MEIYKTCVYIHMHSYMHVVMFVVCVCLLVGMYECIYPRNLNEIPQVFQLHILRL